MRSLVARLCITCAVVAAAGACDDGAPAPRSAPAAEPEPPGPEARFVGRWEGEEVCLELFDDGDFELSVRRRRKRLVMGRATLRVDGEPSATAQLAVSRVWTARWASRCREQHELGHFGDEASALGVRFAAGARVTLRLRVVGEDRLEVCAERCETLRRAPPSLSGRWAASGAGGAAGDVVELEIRRTRHALRIHLGGASSATVDGAAEVRPGEPDGLSIVFTPSAMRGVAPDDAVRVLGSPLALDRTVVLSARREAEQRLRVCVDDRCSTLERQFDSNHTDL